MSSHLIFILSFKINVISASSLEDIIVFDKLISYNNLFFIIHSFRSGKADLSLLPISSLN